VLPAGQEAWRSDCEALWEFYTSLDDVGVLDDANNPHAWGAGTPFVDWQGLSTVARGVVGIDLSRTGLSGTMSPALGRLSNLEILNLHSNSLSGEIPGELGRLSKLTHLHLASNKLKGEIPSELGELAELEILDLRNNELSGRIPPSLANLRDLTQLRLEGNRFIGSMPARRRMQLARAASEALEQPTGDDIAEIYSADPLGLIAHADVFREYSVGPELWEVWTCDIPIGDVILTSNKIVVSLNKEITGYFNWLSNGRYHPTFEYIGNVQAEDRPGVNKQPKQHHRPTGYW